MEGLEKKWEKIKASAHCLFWYKNYGISNKSISEFKINRDDPLYSAAKQPNSWPHDAVGKRLQEFMGD